ncbi:hypothetical protein KPH14_003749 [Odynerus spinipes]|uniref:Uncharacterized protein n=1 Tax=Odynerus spinipes TaxID=1348599 RepID=A0AAD9RXL1_9HYME|nr:hypothetical protein KPH14_003749 [Odynerus spinipes]
MVFSQLFEFRRASICVEYNARIHTRICDNGDVMYILRGSKFQGLALILTSDRDPPLAQGVFASNRNILLGALASVATELGMHACGALWNLIWR